MTSIFGYFDAPDQTEPAFDPGLDVTCPFCNEKLDRVDYRSHNLMLFDGNRSYFYRYCGYHTQSDGFNSRQDEIDGLFIDALVKTQDTN